MPLYPVNLHLAGRPCAVIGGGTVAERKTEGLLAAGASVTVISPQLTPGLAAWVRQRRIRHLAKSYQTGDGQGFFIVICATSDEAVNRLAAAEARDNGALVNVVDAPELGDFSVPAKIEHGDLLLTVSTGGKSPALARRLREELAEHYGPEYGVYITMLERIRNQLKTELASSKAREVFWRQALNAEVLALLKQGKIKEAEARIKHAIGCSRDES